MQSRSIILATVLAIAISISILTIKSTGNASQSSGQQLKLDWCAEHRVPESECTKCNSELIQSFKDKPDWCGGHGIPESHCYLCNPGIKFAQEIEYQNQKLNTKSPTKQLNLDWCGEHRVPESECTKCNSELIQSFKEKTDWCGGHGIPESHCYLCNPGIKFPQEAEYQESKPKSDTRSQGKPNTSIYRGNVDYCANTDAVIQLASLQTADRSGLVVSAVSVVPSRELIEASGETEFAANASSMMTSLTTGTLVEWAVKQGDSVSKGQVIARMESIEVTILRADFLHAKAILSLSETTLQRKENLALEGITSQKEILKVRSEVERARAEYQKALTILTAIGFKENEFKKKETSVRTSLIPIRSRRSGKLVEYKANLGSVVTPGQPLALVADTHDLWVTSQIREKDLPKISLGQTASVSADVNDFQKATGKVIWISDVINPLTRMVPIHIDIDRRDSNLRAHQYVWVEIEIGELEDRFVIPQSAVQWEGCCNVVFVVVAPDRIQPRKVTVEYASGNSYVVAGLNEGEQIVTQGSYLLKTELLKEGIGAGCCGVGA